MTRITEAQMQRNMLIAIQNNRENVNQFSNEVTSGQKVTNPGDSSSAGTIAQFQATLERLKGYTDRISQAKSFLNYQSDSLNSANTLLVRAKEIATQAANESNNSTQRAQMASEVFALRDQLAALANSQYQGNYIYNGANNNTPPFNPLTYTNPATGSASQRYSFGNTAGSSVQNTITIADNTSITLNTPGGQVFSNAINALERLGRALSGYATNPASGTPDGTGNAYVFPTDFSTQTTAITGAIDLLESARSGDIMPEIVSVGAKLGRLDTAGSLNELTKANTQEVLSKLQDADQAESISNLTQAQTALQASYAVTTKILNHSLMDYL